MPHYSKYGTRLVSATPPTEPAPAAGGGRGKLVVIVVVVVAAIVAVVGGYFLLGGGAQVPAYPGAQLTSQSENMGIKLSTYTTDASASSVMDWYRGQMASWEKQYDNTSTYENTISSMLTYKKGDVGVIVIVIENEQGTTFGLYEGPWTTLCNLIFTVEAVVPPTTSMIVCSASGSVYDSDNLAAVENYRNGVVSITVTIQPGSSAIRSIADPAYGGTIITVTNPTSGFSTSVSLPDNISLWGTQITAVNDVKVNAWTVAGAADAERDSVRMKVVMVPDSQGRLTAGSLISIILQPYAIADAHAENVAENRAIDASMWDESQTFNVTITGRDPVSLTGFDGAYLTGSSWTA